MAFIEETTDTSTSRTASIAPGDTFVGTMNNSDDLSDGVRIDLEAGTTYYFRLLFDDPLGSIEFQLNSLTPSSLSGTILNEGDTVTPPSFVGLNDVSALSTPEGFVIRFTPVESTFFVLRLDNSTAGIDPGPVTNTYALTISTSQNAIPAFSPFAAPTPFDDNLIGTD